MQYTNSISALVNVELQQQRGNILRMSCGEKLQQTLHGQKKYSQ